MAGTFVFGVHNHQPLGNFDEVIADAVRLAYRPFFETLRRFPGVRAVVHTSGLLLEWWETHAPDLLALVGELAARGQVEPLTGGWTEPVLPLLPDHDKVEQIRTLTSYVEHRLGVRPRGMWLAERVWEPHLARPLAEAGVEYVLVDDHHFGLAGLDPDRLSGYYLTEEQGSTIAVFPISQRLRYLIPFSPVEHVLATIRKGSRAGCLTMVDDGEKFGAWPETHRTVYTEGWLDAFFRGLTRLEDVKLSLAADYLDGHPPTGRVYLPTASYREMGEWVLSPDAAQELARAASQLEQVAGRDATRLLRGGFWRNFLVRYPEANDTYRKMLGISARVAAGLAARPHDPHLLAARAALWRGQCNDAYWHGVFGGVYLPHLRRAVRTALLTAESALDGLEDPARVVHEVADVDGDGADEVLVRSGRLVVLLRPAEGGTLTELAYRPLAFDLADVLTRRPEHSHRRIAEAERTPSEGGSARTIHETWRVKEAGLERLLAYDVYRRASLQDYLLAPLAVGPAESTGPMPPAEPVEAADVDRAWIAFPGQRYEAKVREQADGVTVELRTEAAVHGTRLELAKTVEVRSKVDGLEAHYELRTDRPLAAGFAIRWNLTLTGPTPDRYYRLETGAPRSLESAGDGAGSRLQLVDDWLGLTAALSWTPAGRIAWEPVYTVSLSEAGLERLWQGVQVTVSWPVRLWASPWTARMGLALARHGGSRS